MTCFMMISCSYSLIHLLVLFCVCSDIRCLDLTLESAANGSSVVHACIAKISTAAIFTSDQQLLRRIAYVETRDGKDYFNSSNDMGGIWQLSYAKYEETKVNTLQALLSDIDLELGITWTNTSWSDLRKPLYSALAARLYLEVISQSIPLVTNINGQGNYWTNYYTSSGGMASDYVAAVNYLNDNEVCQVSGLDLIFVLDSSGSVGHSNFQKMKNFVYNIVNSFDVGLNSVRVGVMSFSNSVNVHLNLNSFSSKSSILSAINNILYTSGGTDTALALNFVRVYGFTISNGARPLSQAVPRIAIVVTDGYSNSYSDTVSAAAAMHNAGIIGFAIGIAGANINELNQIASAPSYVAFISSFNTNLLNNLKVIISQEACETSTELTLDDNITDTIGAGKVKYVNYPLPLDYNGITLQANVTFGMCTVYGSTIVHTPNDAFYDIKMTTSAWDDTYFNQNELSNASTAEKIYLAIESEKKANCTITLRIDKGDSSTDPVDVMLVYSSSVESLLPGSGLIAECIATGKPKPTVIDWYKDGVILTTEPEDYLQVQTVSSDSNITSTLTVTWLTKSHEGKYDCVASNVLPNGTVSDSSSFNITLKKLEKNFTGVAISSTAIHLSWALTGVVIHNYFVMNCVELETKREWDFFVVETHATIISLHPFYSYRCKFQVVGNVSYPFSEAIVIQTHQATPSKSSSSFMAVSEQESIMNFSWVPPPSEYINGVLLGYEIVCTSLTQQMLSTNVSGTSVLLYPVHTNTQYTCTVCAYTIVGCGPTTSTHVFTYEGSPVGPPTSLVSTNISATTITLLWTAPFDPKGVITEYSVMYQIVETTFPIDTPRSVLSVLTNSTASSFTIKSLLADTEYLIEISAVFDGGIGPTSEEIKVSTREKDEYSVRNYYCLSTSSESLFCSWNHSNPEIGFYISGYQLTYRLAPGFDYYPGYGTVLGSVSLSPTQREHNITGLRPYGGYIVEVKCVMSHDLGTHDKLDNIESYSSLINFTQSRVTEGVVQDVQTNAISATSAVISWTPPSRATWNGKMLSYNIKADGIPREHSGYKRRKRDAAVKDVKVFNVLPQANHRDPSLAVEPLQTESFTLENLEENFEYSFVVAIVNSKGHSTPTDPVSVQMPESAPSGPPINIRAINVTASSIMVTWAPPNPFDANGIIILYSLKFEHMDKQYSTDIHSIKGYELVYLQQGLHPYENVTVSMAARTVVGWGPYSKPYAYFTLEKEPGKPMNLQDELINNTRVTLSWEPPKSPNGIIIGYQVIYSGHEETQRTISDGPHEIFINKSDFLQVEISNLTMGYFYEFKVRGQNGAGFGANSTIVILIPSANGSDPTIATSVNSGRLATTASVTLASVFFIILIAIVSILFVIYLLRRNKKKRNVRGHQKSIELSLDDTTPSMNPDNDLKSQMNDYSVTFAENTSSCSSKKQFTGDSDVKTDPIESSSQPQDQKSEEEILMEAEPV